MPVTVDFSCNSLDHESSDGLMKAWQGRNDYSVIQLCSRHVEITPHQEPVPEGPHPAELRKPVAEVVFQASVSQTRPNVGLSLELIYHSSGRIALSYK